MIPTVRFKLTTNQPIERFPNLSPAVHAHTVMRLPFIVKSTIYISERRNPAPNVIQNGSLAAKTEPNYLVKYLKS